MCRQVAKLEFGPKSRNMYVPLNVAEVTSLLLESRVSSSSCATNSQFNRFKDSLVLFRQAFLSTVEKKFIKISSHVGQQSWCKESMRQTGSVIGACME